MFRDKLNRPVATVPVFNRSEHTIREEFPVLGVVEIEPGQIKEIPAEVAELWTDRERWSKQNWPEVPITKRMPKAPPVEVEEPRSAGPVATPKKRE